MMVHGQARRLRARKRPAQWRCFCRALTLLKSLAVSLGAAGSGRDRQGEREIETEQLPAAGWLYQKSAVGNPFHSMARPFHSRIAVTFFFPVKSEKGK